MIRDLGPYVPRRSHKLNPPIMAMLFNALHDRHEGRVFVLQVGAGNGETGLPLLPRFRNDGWSGLLIEPLPQNFAQLEALHHDSDRVAILNLGISDVSANLPIFSLTPAADARNRRTPRGRASLDRRRIASSAVPDEDVQEAEIPVLRMDIVLEELGIDTVQLLVVNAGGHEEQVLSCCDLAALDPSLILLHTAPDSPVEASCIATLTTAGFIPFLVGGWVVGLAPGRLAVPLEELLTFFGRGIGAIQDDDE
ncbi:MAG: FkbM family methyltransferase [Tabrizicola sp.]